MSNFGSRILGFFGGTASGGGGGTNPTNGYMPYNAGGFFADSYWFVDNTGTFTTSSKGGGSPYGFKMDITDKKTYIGDLINTWFEVDNSDNHIRTKSGGSLYGMFIDGTNKVTIGDYDLALFQYELRVEDDFQTIKSFLGGAEMGFRFPFFNLANFDIEFGRFNTTIIETGLKIGNSVAQITTHLNSSVDGLQIDANAIQLGNLSGSASGNVLQLSTNLMTLLYQGLQFYGFEIDYASSLYRFGYIDTSKGEDYTFDIDKNLKKISTKVVINFGFLFDKNVGYSIFGDYDNLQNGTYFGVDTINNKLLASSNLLATLSTSFTGTILKVYVDGVGLRRINIFV